MGENRFIIEKTQPIKFSMSLKNSRVDTMRVITDTKTGVEYLYFFSNDPAMGSGLTLLVDREGKPLINENYR